MLTHLSNTDARKMTARYAAGECTSVLAAEYGCSLMTVHNWCQRNGVPMRSVGSGSRRYTLNESYFDIIDTEEKAYWLGLLGADGYVSRRSNSIELGLSGEEEKELLHRFARALGTNAPISPHRLKYTGAQAAHRLTISSARMKASLVRHGITPVKSLTYQLNRSLPPHLFRHYLRGYFDGDGSVSIKLKGGVLVGVTSSPMFIAGLAQEIKAQLGLEAHVERPTDRRCRNLKIGGNFVSFLFLDWLYRDATIYLPRKHAKYVRCRDAVIERLTNPHQFYNLYTHPKVMTHASRCAAILGISFEMSQYNGLSISPKEQLAIIALYQEGYGIPFISRRFSCSNRLILNVLERNNIPRRTGREASLLQWKRQRAVLSGGHINAVQLGV